jgi:hypothetical protein
MTRIRLVLLFLTTLFFSSSIRAAEYQWSIPLDSNQPTTYPRAFLWIPPTCSRVRAVIVAQHNMLEESILEHPDFRKTMSDLNIAMVWITPKLDGPFDPARSGERFNHMMKSLAAESGYDEIAFAPIIPMGHSACASYPWNFAAWAPQRTLCILSIHGDAPGTPMAGFGKPNAPWGDRNIDGVPGLMVMGEFEWLEDRLAPAFTYQNAHPKAPIAVLAEPGNGHFNACDELVHFLTMFIRKSAEQRLPANAPLDSAPTLKPIDPQQGWLVQRWTLNKGRTIPPAPFAKYTGDPKQAFWAYDEEMAAATQNYFADQPGKQPQLIGFVQDGKVVPFANTLEMQRLKFEPEEDGITFKLSATFLDHVDPGSDNLKRWSALPFNTPLGHSTSQIPIRFTRIEGPIRQIAPDTFRLSFYRANPASQNIIYFYASHPGDEKYKRAIEQACINLPRNTTGADQQVTFPKIEDQKEETTSLKLSATSDAKVPVYYYIREGPAEIDSDVLKFTAVPPRSKFPVKVTIVAWQWGHPSEPKLKSAEPIEQTFNIVK